MAKKIPTRPLGKTGFNVSTLGYGCSGYWGYPVFNEAKAIGLIEQALEAGVNYFDTGPEYSLGHAEARLGRAIKGTRRKLLIASKVGTVRTKNGGIKKDFSPDVMRAQIEQSLERLGLKQLPLLNLHSPRPQDLTDETFAALAQFKKEKLIKWLGISAEPNTGPLVLNRKDIDVLMLTYNVIEQGNATLINQAAQRGLGVIIKAPLCRTLYSNEIFKIRRPNDIWYLLRVMKNFRKQFWQGRKLQFINHIDGLSSHDIALRFALHDAASCVVSSTTNPENLARNIEAIKRDLPAELTDQIIQAVV